MKKLVFVILIFVTQIGFGQNNWPSVGTKWWYDNATLKFFEGIYYYRSCVGLNKNDCYKDTLIGTKTYPVIRNSNVNCEGKTSGYGAIRYLIRTNNNINEYSYLPDTTTWYLHSIINPAINQTVFNNIDGYSQKFYLQFTVTGINNVTLNGINLQTYRLKTFLNSLEYSFTFLENIGWNGGFRLLINENPTTEPKVESGPIRCYETSGILSKFDSTLDCEELINDTILNVFNSDVKFEISANPNPINDLIYIETPNETILADLKIYNLFGEELLFKKEINTNGIKIDMTLLPSGIYFLHLNTEKNTQILKLIKV